MNLIETEIENALKRRNEIVDLFLKAFVVTHYEGNTAKEIARSMTETMALHMSTEHRDGKLVEKYWLDLKPEAKR